MSVAGGLTPGTYIPALPPASVSSTDETVRSAAARRVSGLASGTQGPFIDPVGSAAGEDRLLLPGMREGGWRVRTAERRGWLSASRRANLHAPCLERSYSGLFLHQV